MGKWDTYIKKNSEKTFEKLSFLASPAFGKKLNER